MKKQLALATAALMALSLAACGSSATAPKPPPQGVRWVFHQTNSSTTTTKFMLSIFRIDATFLIKEAAHEIFL